MHDILKYGWVFGFLALCGFLLSSVNGSSQTVPVATVSGALSNLGVRAGVVFAGEVTAVRHIGGVVEVELRVDQTLKGATSSSYVLREWSGLWASGQRRYWVGERAVMFLYQPGKYGLTSPVDGMEGILPISPLAAGLSVDAARLQTTLPRTPGVPLVQGSASMSIAQVAQAVRSEPTSSPAPVIPPTEIPLPAPPTRRPPVIIRPKPIPADFDAEDSSSQGSREVNRAIEMSDDIL